MTSEDEFIASVEAFIASVEAFIAKHGRAAWWQVMADHRVDTLAGAIQHREAIARTLKDLS